MGLLCPLPIIKLQQAMKNMEYGDEIRITATDTGVKHDIPAWCRVHHHQVLSIEEKDCQICIVVRKVG